MDNDVIIIGDDGTEHVFPAGFDPKRAAAIVRSGSAPPSSGPPATAVTAAGLTAAKMAPAVMRGIHAVATGVGDVAKKSAGKYALGGVAIDAAGRVARGDYKGAALSGATAGAMSQVPRIAAAVRRATNPARVAVRSGTGQFIRGARPAGAMMRGAGWLSNAAGMVAGPALAMSTAYDTQQALIAKANDPSTPPEEREALMRIATRATGGSRSR